MGDLKEFPKKGDNGGQSAQGQLPPIIECLPEGPICPVMGASIQVMPIIRQAGGLLVPQGQGQQMAITRQYTPCLEARCAWWDPDGACGQVFPSR